MVYEDDRTDGVAGVSNDAVQAATGKGWAQWLAILDASGARTMPHPQIARILHEQHGVSDWWSQMVTVGYEQARGLRQVHEKSDGFTANASRTFAVPVATLYAAWFDEARRNAWLPNAAITIRKATADRSLRITWSDGSNLDVNFYAKADAKAQVSLQHSRLPDAETAAAMKAFWRNAFDRLKAALG